MKVRDGHADTRADQPNPMDLCEEGLGQLSTLQTKSSNSHPPLQVKLRWGADLFPYQEQPGSLRTAAGPSPKATFLLGAYRFP